VVEGTGLVLVTRKFAVVRAGVVQELWPPQVGLQGWDMPPRTGCDGAVAAKVTTLEYQYRRCTGKVVRDRKVTQPRSK